MNLFDRLFRVSIRQRLIWGNLTISLLLLLATVLVVWQMNRLSTAVSQLQIATNGARIALEVQENSSHLLRNITQHLTAQDRLIFSREVSLDIEQLSQTHAMLIDLRQNTDEEETIYALLVQTDNEVGSIINQTQTMVALAQTDDWSGVKILTNILAREQDQLREMTDALIQASNAMEATAVARVNKIRQAVVFYPAIIVGVSIILVSLLTWITSRRIAQPVEELTKAAQQLATGAMDSRITITRSDELGQLALAFNHMADRVQTLQASLERLVQDRTKAIETSAAISRRLSTILDQEQAVLEVVKLLQNAFNYYYVQVYLYDPEQNLLTVSGGTGKAGQLMIDQGRTIPLGTGVVGRTAVLKTTLCIADVVQYPYWVPHPYLKDTRSELAVPILLAGRLLGVLDLQSLEANAFNAQDVTILEAVADQLAITIRNTELFHIAEVARREAEKSDELKSRFLANMSHELRTPLNAIINFSFLLLTDPDNPLIPDHQEMIERVSEAGDHLLELINNVLDLSRIESGVMELALEEVALPPLINSAVATGQGLIKEKPINIWAEIPDDLPPIYGDRTRVRQVLLNLVSNAVKFTDEGNIIIHAIPEAKQIKLKVQDSGIGIASEDIAKIFEEFVQVDGEFSRRARGTGLGLPISKQFVEMQGGQMWVESMLGEGSTFYFTLPYYKQETH